MIDCISILNFFNSLLLFLTYLVDNKKISEVRLKKSKSVTMNKIIEIDYFISCFEGLLVQKGLRKHSKHARYNSVTHHA